MTQPLQPPRSYRRFHSALQALPGLADEGAHQEAFRVIYGRLLRAAGARTDGGDAPASDRALTAAVGGLFDRWAWRDTNGIGPGSDLLGYLFEQSLARKALGAYFTPPDVASYIARSVIIPRLFDLVDAPIDLRALAGDEGIARYLPARLLSDARLPSETDCEQRQRSHRVAGLKRDFHAGRISGLDDCVTHNLDLLRITLDFVLQEQDEVVVARLLECLRGLRILDPTCGSGDFLLAAFDLLASLFTACYSRLGMEGAPNMGAEIMQSLHGVDLHPGAVEVCGMRLQLRRMAPDGTGNGPCAPGVRASLTVGDFLEPAPESRTETFDVVLGNPPYLGSASDRERLSSLGYHTARCGNLYASVMERSLQVLAPRGRLGMIVPISSVAGADYLPLADRLMRGTAWVSTYSNRPAKLFEGVEQRLAIWLAVPDAPRQTFASAYQHWWLEERDLVFERLRYTSSPLCAATGMPAKTGSPQANTIFAKLCAHRWMLGELAAGGDASVWLHDGPTYWVRALTFEPNQGRKSGRSGHYRRLATADVRTAHLLAAVLSSTTFYLYFKLTSNCRDLGRKEWARFPMDALCDELAAPLTRAGETLQHALRRTALIRTRVYPSGPVEYEEYFPARAKSALDEIDRLLAAHYGFTDEEVEYILNYDLK
ncbi:MAG: Eco57I restriction-modification methylase domain-containing protein, partial [Actinomycetota bacterium]